VFRTHPLLSLVILSSFAFASSDCSRRSPAASTQTRSSIDTAAPALQRTNPARAPLPAEITFAEYRHPRAGFALRYPSFLAPFASPHNNNGITFRDGDRVALSVIASPDLYPDQTNDEQLRMAMDRRGTDGNTQILERRALADGYVGSGVHGTRTFYERRLRTAGRVVTLAFDYDAALRDRMGAVVDEVVRSVRVGAARDDD
jgi:hypothetical protein